MENGRIIERGTHQQLMRSHGAYEQMWGMQKRQSEDDISTSI
jgi:ATP-binding cassette subfamily B protein